MNSIRLRKHLRKRRKEITLKIDFFLFVPKISESSTKTIDKTTFLIFLFPLQRQCA